MNRNGNKRNIFFTLECLLINVKETMVLENQYLVLYSFKKKKENQYLTAITVTIQIEKYQWMLTVVAQILMKNRIFT